jgi:hypothetical protein
VVLERHRSAVGRHSWLLRRRRETRPRRWAGIGRLRRNVGTGLRNSAGHTGLGGTRLARLSAARLPRHLTVSAGLITTGRPAGLTPARLRGATTRLRGATTRLPGSTSLAARLPRPGLTS